MKTTIRHIFLVSLLLLSLISGAIAQSGFFIPKDGKIFFNGDSSTIFSDVLNLGKFGVGKGALVNFQARQWENDPQSVITDESNAGDGTSGAGGFVRFLSTDTLPQLLIGGYNAATRLGPAFSNLNIETRRGLELVGSNAKVRNELALTDGLVYVKNNILVVGENNPGTITGFDAQHYIVTDDKGSAGFLLRSGITRNNGLVVFPIGSKQNAYTPAGIQSKTDLPDNYYINVTDGVKSELFRTDFTDDGVDKTWQIGKSLRPLRDEVEVSLQHLNSDEGKNFTANKSNAYVSIYAQKLWDIGTPQASPSDGSLTTGPTLINSGLNSRTFNGSIGSASYFTKLTGKGDTNRIKTLLWFNGYRLDADFTRIYWRTNPEINNLYFVVQRRLSNESDFRNIDTVLTKSINGLSINDLNYEIRDANAYNGISFYRLMLVGANNDSTYSNIIAIAPMPGKYKLLLWPNPTPDKFFIGLNGEVSVKAIVIWNAIGQKLRVEYVNGRSIIEMNGLIPGTYMIGFISTTNQIIETKRLVVIGR